MRQSGRFSLPLLSLPLLCASSELMYSQKCGFLFDLPALAAPRRATPCTQPPCTSLMSLRPYDGGESPASGGRAAESHTSSRCTTTGGLSGSAAPNDRKVVVRAWQGHG